MGNERDEEELDTEHSIQFLAVHIGLFHLNVVTLIESSLSAILSSGLLVIDYKD
jgi:hypothetical protein